MDGLVCLVVSLPRSVQRRAGITAALDACGIAFSFVDAVDAAQGFDAVSETRLARRADGTISDAEYACALSHADAYRRFLRGGATHALVLEDDALPGEELPRFVREGHFRACPMLLLFHSRARVLGRRGIPLFGAITARPLALSCTGAVAYTLDREAASRLLAANMPVSAVADWPMDIAELGAHVLDPMIVGHPERVDAQSNLSAHRAGNRRPRDMTRYLAVRYLRRRYRKMISTRIS